MQEVKEIAIMANFDSETIETLLTVNETAHVLKMSPAFVRRVADEVGAVRMRGGRDAPDDCAFPFRG